MHRPFVPKDKNKLYSGEGKVAKYGGQPETTDLEQWPHLLFQWAAFQPPSVPGVP